MLEKPPFESLFRILRVSEAEHHKGESEPIKERGEVGGEITLQVNKCRVHKLQFKLVSAAGCQQLGSSRERKLVWI